MTWPSSPLPATRTTSGSCMSVRSRLIEPSPPAARQTDFGAQLKGWQTRIEHELTIRLPSVEVQPSRLHEAIRYSVLGAGKRVRPALIYATGAALRVPESMLD